MDLHSLEEYFRYLQVGRHSESGTVEPKEIQLSHAFQQLCNVSRADWMGHFLLVPQDFHLWLNCFELLCCHFPVGLEDTRCVVSKRRYYGGDLQLESQPLTLVRGPGSREEDQILTDLYLIGTRKKFSSGV